MGRWNDMTTNETKYKIIGRIHYINKDKGYGFIVSEEIPFKKIYFYWTELRPTVDFQSLRRFSHVEFDASENEKGWQARNIGLVDEPEESGPGMKEATVTRIK